MLSPVLRKMLNSCVVAVCFESEIRTEAVPVPTFEAVAHAIDPCVASAWASLHGGMVATAVEKPWGIRKPSARN
jgi:hypothetical protein